MPNKSVTLLVSMTVLDVDGDELIIAVSLGGRPSFLTSFRDDEGEEWKYANG